MQQNKNKKYIGFPIMMILITFAFTFVGYAYGNISDTLKNYDVTGLTTAFMYMMLILEIAMLGFCIYKGVKGQEEGFDYLFSKFACIIFAVFIIVPIISYFVVIGAEESTANELKQKEDDLFNNVIVIDGSSNKKNKKKTKTNEKISEYMDIQQNDEFYKRKLQIVAENRGKSRIERLVKIKGYVNE